MCFDPIPGTVPAYFQAVAMGGSRRLRSDQHFITVRDEDLKSGQSALKALSKIVEVLHSTWKQRMLLLDCFLVGCCDRNLLAFYGLSNIGAESQFFGEGSSSQPRFLAAALQLRERSLEH